MRANRSTGFASSIAILITIVIGVEPLFFIATTTNAANLKSKQGRLSSDQKITQVLTRLTFGIRPGDFEHVKSIGVKNFIAQQLDPESISDAALDQRLHKLPTLAIGTPELIEQYTPPKPVLSPSPSPPPSMPVPVLPRSATTTVSEPPALIAGAEQQPKMDSMMQPQASPPPMKTAVSGPKDSQASQKTPAPTPMKNSQMVVTELQRAALLRAVYSERQLFEVMTNFWENHFSIFVNKDADRFLLTEFDRDRIRPFALGSFRDLLGATAHSPAMLFYLDNWQSTEQHQYPATKDKPARTVGGINENYARELMELHTLGVGGGYTQKDVQEVARCFTGWTIRKPNEVGLFFFNPRTHDNGEKIVLGHKIPAGGGISDGEKVLDILASHPSTAKFIASKLARRFISDDPPPALVNRAAATFLKTNGSIRETLRVIITSPEFFSAGAYRAKTRTPFEYVAAAMRAVEAETDADPSVLGWIARMGQPVFGRISPDGYPDRAEQWLGTGSFLERLNFAVALASNKLKGTHINANKILGQTDLNNPPTGGQTYFRTVLPADLSEETRRALDKVVKDASANPQMVTPLPSTNAIQQVNFANRTAGGDPKSQTVPQLVIEVVSVVLCSPEFQRR